MSGGRTADISLLGHYGICNPNLLWLFEQEPDLLAYTPEEWGRQPMAAPKCYVRSCQATMSFRYAGKRPAWVCYQHERPARQLIGRPKPKMLQAFDFDLQAEIEAARAGLLRELVWNDEGEPQLVERPR